MTLCFFCHHEALCTLSVLTIQFLLRRNFFEEFHRETIVSLPRNVTPAWTQLSDRLASEPFLGGGGRKKVKVANEGGKVLGRWKQVPGFDCGGGAPPISCLWGPSHPLTSLPPANDCVEIFLPHGSRVPVSLHTGSSNPGFSKKSLHRAGGRQV